MITIPLLHLLQTCSTQDNQWITEKILAHAIQDDDVTRIIQLMQKQGSLSYSTARAREYVEAATLDLEPFPACTAKRSLAITACYMVNRDQ